MSGPHTKRRQFLGGLLAAGLVPRPTWADVGSPAYLSSAALRDGSFVLCGISANMDVLFQIPLPARGHAAATHPTRPEAVAFARRPGTFALLIDCVSGQPKATLKSPEGRHFYGHGVFSTNGDWLFTTENDYEAGRGRIGIWDARANYARIDEFDSGGIGPHDIKRLPGSDALVVANGGIDTHPDTGRTKLNLPTMRSNLAYIEHGQVVEVVTLPNEMQKNSIRHLATGPTGDVAFGMQWQGDGPVDALVGQHRLGAALGFLSATPNQVRALNGYIGSIAYSRDGSSIAATSPRGGCLHLYDTQAARHSASIALRDVCGVAPNDQGFILTSGTGELRTLRDQRQLIRMAAAYTWDNHLISL